MGRVSKSATSNMVRLYHETRKGKKLKMAQNIETVKPEETVEPVTLDIVDMKMDVVLTELDAKTKLIGEQDKLIRLLRGQLKLSTDLHEAGMKAELRNWVLENTDYSYEETYAMDVAGLKEIKDIYKRIKAPQFISSADAGKVPAKSLDDLFEYGVES